MPADRDAHFGDVAVYNGGDAEEKTHELALITSPDSEIDQSTGIANLAVMDRDGNWTIREDVPYRSPRDYEAGGGGGHTWHWNDDNA